LESRRRLAVRLLDGGLDPPEVADLVEATIRSVQRWRVAGDLTAVPQPGRPPKLTSRQSAQVLTWLDRRPTAFGFATERWTAPRVADLVARRLGVAMHPRYLNRWLAHHGGITPQVPRRQAIERDEAVIARWRRSAWPRIKRRAANVGATLGFSDEAGFLPLPLVRTTLAPRGRTPVLAHRAAHREKLSVAAALALSPGSSGRIGLHCLTFPDAYVDAAGYAAFVHDCLLPTVRGPLVLLHDGGQMHRGPALREVLRTHPRLTVQRLPPYAPELNPVEGVWNFAKDKELANFVPRDLDELHEAVRRCLCDVRRDQHRLRSFFHATPLSWHGTTLLK